MEKKQPKRNPKADSSTAPEVKEHADRLRSMCNHGLISGEHANDVIYQIQCGAQTVEGAIVELQESCSCGLFLPSRARRILNAATKAS